MTANEPHGKVANATRLLFRKPSKPVIGIDAVMKTQDYANPPAYSCS